MAFKNYPNLEPFFNEVRDYIKANQGEKGYIDTQDKDKDTIYALVYEDAEFRAVDKKVYAVRVKDDDIEVFYDDVPLTYDLSFTEDDFKDERRWDSIRWSDIVYYIHTLFYIADFIEEYV